ncbi:segregation/condensation protein A [Candidatus Woesearchaeota archaeon]|nr:segregation/condensation protein A [Candidatus Woesearchaeota archaeon]
MHDRVFQIVVEQNELTWKQILYDLIKAEQMDPWDVDVSVLTQKYLQRIHELKEHDLQVSGKIILAAAMLLKMKSKRLVGEDLNEFDRLLASAEMTEDEFYHELEGELQKARILAPEEMLKLIPRTPQPRKRKVSVFDLVRALEKALEVKHRRLIKIDSPEGRLIIPQKKIDITLAIKQIYKSIREWFVLHRKPNVQFSELLPEHADKDAKLYTFVPLLHLGTERKVDLTQNQPFDDFSIRLRKEEQKDSTTFK